MIRIDDSFVGRPCSILTFRSRRELLVEKLLGGERVQCNHMRSLLVVVVVVVVGWCWEGWDEKDKEGKKIREEREINNNNVSVLKY